MVGRITVTQTVRGPQTGSLRYNMFYPPMNSPLTSRCPSSAGFLSSALCLVLLLVSLNACGGKLVKETVAEPKVERPAPPPTSVPTWLGNTRRNFYGTGPWSDRPNEVLWEFETKLT